MSKNKTNTRSFIQKKLTVNLARGIVKGLEARGVIVLAFDADGFVGGVSYGETTDECAEMGKTLDAMAELLEENQICK